MEKPILNRIDHIETFSEYLQEIEKFRSKNHHVLLFRGQSSDAPLLPSIARTNPSVDTTAKEKIMLSELKRRGGFLAEIKQMDDWELIVFAQHHEMKTRLLDWSSNPLAALWFACQSEFMMKEDSYVYVLTGTENFEVNPDKDVSPFTLKKTKVLRPSLNNARIIAQSGWFTIQRYSTSNGKFVALEQNKDFRGNISRIKIPSFSKESMLENLSMCGVRSSTIFPDIIGLCKHMNWKFRKEGDNSNPA